MRPPPRRPGLLLPLLVLVAACDDPKADAPDRDAAGAPDGRIEPSAPDAAPPEDRADATPGTPDATPAAPDAAAPPDAAPAPDAAPDPDAEPSPPDASADVAPRFTALAIGADDALDGTATTEAGMVTYTWATEDASEVHFQEPVENTSDCASVPSTAWANTGTGPAAGSTTRNWPDGRDRCVRFVASADVTVVGERRVVAIDILPRVSVTPFPTSVPPAGGTVTVFVGLRGAASVVVSTRALDAGGATLAETVRCDSNDSALPFQDLNLPTAAVCSVVLVAADLPAGTARVRFVVTAVDDEGDTNTETRSIPVQ